MRESTPPFSPRHAVQLIMVSDQAAPNLLPALDPAMKPKQIVMLVTDRMRARADCLSQAFTEAGIKVSMAHLGAGASTDYENIQKTVYDVLETNEPTEVAVNLTGGTKLMAIAARSAMQDSGARAFYVDIESGDLIWLDDPIAHQKLKSTVRLSSYLKAYGFDVHSKAEVQGVPPAQQQLFTTLVNDIGALGHALTQLNWLGQKAERDNTLSIPISEAGASNQNLDALIDHFGRAEMIERRGDTLCYKTEDARDFCKGGWLERLVYQEVEALSGPLAIRDKAMGLELERDSVRNELDVAFLHANRFFVIECKTALMDHQTRPNKANDTVFKLDNIANRVGGLGYRTMLVSYRSFSKSEESLVRALNVRLVQGRDIKNLESHLRDWVSVQH